MNKQISTKAGIAVAFFFFLIAVLAIWKFEKNTEKIFLGTTLQNQNKAESSGQGFIDKKTGGTERGCLDSGGLVVESSCCNMTGDFPNSCAIGACGCAPAYSHQIKTCNCGAGKCFDGNSCAVSKK